MVDFCFRDSSMFSITFQAGNTELESQTLQNHYSSGSIQPSTLRPLTPTTHNAMITPLAASMVLIRANLGRAEFSSCHLSLKQDIWQSASCLACFWDLLPSSRNVLYLHSGSRKNTQSDTSAADPAQNNPAYPCQSHAVGFSW